MFKIKLHWQILIAIVLGFFFGLFFYEYTAYTNWIGDVFIRALKLIIVPLLLTSITSGVSNVGNEKNLGKLGLRTLTYYISTSLLAILTGQILVNVFKPGVGADLGFKQVIVGVESTSGSLQDTLYSIVPTNIFDAMAKGNMLGIIVFSILMGFFITKITNVKYSTLLIDFFNAGFELMMNITNFIIKFTPFGIFSLFAKLVAEQAGDIQNLKAIFMRLGAYMLVVLGGLFIHAFITLPLLLKFIGKVNPIKHFKALATPLLTAFSTSSSNAALPLTMEAVEENVGVSNKISSFVLPLGATINMDGTALYECVAVIFIAQAYGIELTLGQQIIITFTALLASIGAAGIPMAGLVMMTMVLSAVGLPLEGIGLILAVDRILDMFRTTVNVLSDNVGAAIIAKSEGETLKI